MEKWIHGNIDEFIDWHDVDGNVINASDGGILFAEGKYHWYGQALGDAPYNGDGAIGGQTTRVGVVMYESEDLLNWKYEGVILACEDESTGQLRSPMRFERPKIIYNEKTKQYVLWCHYVGHPGNHGYEAGSGEAGVAVCDRVNGKYRWLGHRRPIDDRGMVRDCTLYKDKDGTAYFIYDRDTGTDFRPPFERCLHIVKLSEDYLSCTSEYHRIDVGYNREAPAILFDGTYYYMITSGLTGWAFNGAKYFRAESLMGPWTDMGDPCVGDEEQTTFCSQTTAVFPVEGKENTFIHMAERHNTKNFLHCAYIWLPVEFGEDHTLRLVYRKEWSPEELGK